MNFEHVYKQLKHKHDNIKNEDKHQRRLYIAEIPKQKYIKQCTQLIKLLLRNMCTYMYVGQSYDRKGNK